MPCMCWLRSAGAKRQTDGMWAPQVLLPGCLVVAGVAATGWHCCGYTVRTGVAGCALQLHQQHAASGRNEKVLRMEVGNPPTVVVQPERSEILHLPAQQEELGAVMHTQMISEKSMLLKPQGIHPEVNEWDCCLFTPCPISVYYNIIGGCTVRGRGRWNVLACSVQRKWRSSSLVPRCWYST